MPSMGRADNALLVFRWHFRLVPMALYPPKVPSLSLEGAIGKSGKQYRAHTKSAILFYYERLSCIAGSVPVIDGVCDRLLVEYARLCLPVRFVLS